MHSFFIGFSVAHDLVDFPDFPLLRLVKGMVQSFRMDQLGEDLCAVVIVKEGLYQPRLGVLRLKLLLPDCFDSQYFQSTHCKRS